MRQAIDAVRQTLAEASPVASVRFATFDDMAAASAQRERLMARLGGFFGAIALLLAAVGVYGVVAYSASTRRREIGIRLALGARARHVVRTVVGRMALVVAAGCVAGLILTLSTGKMAASLLYGVELDDPRIIALILGTIVVSGIVAAAIPARRALHTDPVLALKAE
jgi:ABC-type antimicrobial peptide transport system permease subunit